MGPRQFIARRFTKYLLQHGQLAKQCRMYEDQRLLELQSSAIQSDGILSLLLSLYNKSTYHVHNLQFDINHVAMLFIAVLVITSYKKKDVEQKRKHRVYNSKQQKSSSKDIDTIILVLANISLYLMALLCFSSIVGDSLVDLKELDVIDKVVSISERIGMPSILNKIIISVSEEMYQGNYLSRQLSKNYLLVLSLLSILMSIILTVIGYVWSLLDPRNTAYNIETKQKKTWQRMVSAMARNIAKAISVEVILTLSYIYLPFISKIFHGELDFGLPQGLVHFLDRVISSFIGYCIFSKLLQRPDVAVQVVSDGVRKTKKYAVNPEMVKRMSSLANEARERVEARNRRGTKQLRRTFSEGNFQKSYSPRTPTRHRSSLTALPESTSPDKEKAEWKKWLEESPKTPTTPMKKYVEKFPANSPLRDIHLAGPTLSSSDLLAKLKNNKSLARSGSTGCFVALPDLTRNMSDEST